MPAVGQMFYETYVFILFLPELNNPVKTITVLLICKWENKRRKLKSDLNPATKWQGQYSGSGLLDLKVQFHHTGFPLKPSGLV